MAIQSVPPTSASTITRQEAPWQFSPQIIERMHLNSGEAFARLEVAPDTREHQFVRASFERNPPPNRFISQVWCIHNPLTTKAFEIKLLQMEREATNPHFQATWQEEENAPLRQVAFNHWQKTSLPCSVKHPEEDRHLKDVHASYMWHGTSKDRGLSICETGFSYFGSPRTDLMNDGQAIFGNGIYFTSSAEYASSFSSSNDLLFSCVSMRAPYPVISDKITLSPDVPPDVRVLKGSSFRGNYNAHYIPVIPVDLGEGKIGHHPCINGLVPKYDELVIFNPAQALAHFWVKIDVYLIANPTTKIQIAAINALSSDILKKIKEGPIPQEILKETCANLKEALQILESLQYKLPERAFGKNQWKEFFDLDVEEPPLPDTIDQILGNPCPFFPGKKVIDTHFLTLIPKGMTLEQLENLILNHKDKKVRIPHKDENVWSQLSKKPSEKTHWALMPTDILPGSKEKTWKEQQEMAQKYSAQGYQIVSIIDAACCILLEYIHRGEKFYLDSTATYVRCAELVEDGFNKWPAVFGAFASMGPGVFNHHGDANKKSGIGVQRMFF